MNDTKEQLIKLGSGKPDLRPHIRKVLDELTKKTGSSKMDQAAGRLIKHLESGGDRGPNWYWEALEKTGADAYFDETASMKLDPTGRSTVYVLRDGADQKIIQYSEHRDQWEKRTSRKTNIDQLKTSSRTLGYEGRLPSSIEKEMGKWRAGVGSMKPYIEYHKKKARAVLSEIVRKHDLNIKKITMKKDGWMDGMKVLHAEVITPSGKALELKWKDSHGSGYFMDNTGSGASKIQKRDLT